MANAKKLTAPQIAALQAAAKGESAWRAAKEAYRNDASRGRRRHRTAGRSASTTVNALASHGLIEFDTHYIPARSLLTPAGRQALFEATGEGIVQRIDTYGPIVQMCERCHERSADETVEGRKLCNHCAPVERAERDRHLRGRHEG